MLAPSDGSTITANYAQVRLTVEHPARHEVTVREVYEAVLQTGDIAVDGGAHSGKHTIPMARAVGTTGGVLAAEPLKEARARLEANLAESGLTNVTVIAEAFSDAPDQVVEFLYFASRPGVSGFKRRLGPELTAETRSVRTTTIDHELAGRGAQFLKLDVEGAELMALAGANETVNASRPVIHIEAGDVSWQPYGFTSADLWEWCESNDYHCFDVIGSAIASRESLEASFKAAGVWDYIAVPHGSPYLTEILNVLNHAAQDFNLQSPS